MSPPLYRLSYVAFVNIERPVLVHPACAAYRGLYGFVKHNPPIPRQSAYFTLMVRCCVAFSRPLAFIVTDRCA